MGRRFYLPIKNSHFSFEEEGPGMISKKIIAFVILCHLKAHVSPELFM